MGSVDTFYYPSTIDLSPPDQQDLEFIPGDEYAKVNEQLDRVFIEDVYTVISDEFDPSPFVWDQPQIRPVQIDGRFTTNLEYGILSKTLEIVTAQITEAIHFLLVEIEAGISNAALLPEAEQETVARNIQSQLEQAESLKRFLQSVVAYNGYMNETLVYENAIWSGLIVEKTEPKNIDAQMRQDLVAAIEWTLPSTQGYERTCLVFTLKELEAFEHLGEAENNHVYPRVDLNNNDSFLNFVSNRTELSPTFVAQLKASPFDYLESDQAQAPTLIVYLDYHKRLSVQKAIFTDLVAFRSLNPVFGFESPQAGLLYEENLKNSKEQASLIRETRKLETEIELLEKNLECQMLEISGDEGAKTCWNQWRQSSNEQMNTEDSSNLIETCQRLPFQERTQFIGDHVDLLMGEGNGLGDLIELCLYQGGVYAFGDAFPTIEYEAEPAVGLLNELIAAQRSRMAVDDVLSKMRAQHNDLGVMVMGEGHYLSIRSYLERSGEVNVIFMQPTEYLGPMPEM